MAVVTKILEQTLTAGQTAVVFTDTDIPNSLIRVFSSNSDVIPVSRILSGSSLTVTYEAQNYNMDVALEIVKQGLDIVDNLTSTDTDKALSAKQGKALKDSLDTLSTTVAGLVIPEDITDLNDIEITDIEDGQVLAWDDVEQKFVNVDQSGGETATLTTKAWTASSSSAVGTVLTETANLDAGIYIISIHTAPCNINTLQAFALSINNTIDNSTIEAITPSYGNYVKLISLASSSSVTFVTASGASMLWDSTYHDRGGMDIIKLK